MAQVSVEVPASLVGAVRESVLLLYDATAEALHLGLRAHADGRATLDEVRLHRARLDELGRLLDRLGWRDSEPPGEAAEAAVLSGPADVLHDALYGAMIDAGERLATACERCWRGELALERLEESGREVIALDGLLQQIRAGR
jgi:hypothetical protein